jgi:hypothetical protein
MKPTPSRKSDVLEKIEYALDRYQHLIDVLFESKKTSTDPKFLVHTSAEILSTIRESFDYLAQDIVECHIIPFSTNQKLKQDHLDGKLKAYFPYYESQVTKPSTIFFELSRINPLLYQELLGFTYSIAKGTPIPDTRYSYKLLSDVKEMVNEKKHDKLIGVVSEVDREYLIENNSMKILLHLVAQPNWFYFVVETGTVVQKVTEYRFSFNNQEVGKFCLYATKTTEHVISNLYQAHFA